MEAEVFFTVRFGNVVPCPCKEVMKPLSTPWQRQKDVKMGRSPSLELQYPEVFCSGVMLADLGQESIQMFLEQPSVGDNGFVVRRTELRNQRG